VLKRKRSNGDFDCLWKKSGIDKNVEFA